MTLLIYSRSVLPLSSRITLTFQQVDVEGSEFAVLKQVIDEARGRPLPFAQLQLEIHAWYAESELSFKDYLEWFELLESAGLRPFSEPSHPLPYGSMSLMMLCRVGTQFPVCYDPKST